MTLLQRILNIVLLPLILIAAFLIVKAMIASKPERQTRTPPVAVPSVAFVEVAAADFHPTIQTFGNTRSYYEAAISAQVSGEVIRIEPSFNSGQTISKGELLLQIDPADYLADVAQAEANLATAQQILSEEKTRATLAAQDWTDSGRRLEDATDLTLRKPQLIAAEAGVTSAQASLERAKNDLEDTQVRAPFDAIVQSRDTSPGNYVNAGTSLGQLISRELAEVRLPLTPQQLEHIDLPHSGSSSELLAELSSPSQPGAKWTATITRTEPSVDQQNQVIYVVGEIKDPFADEQAFLPIGAFVDARISGNALADVYLIPSTALVEDRFVWVIKDDDTLGKEPVARLLAEEDSFAVRFESTGSAETFRVATRPLASFVDGQTVKPIAPAL